MSAWTSLPAADRRLLRLEVAFLLHRQRWQAISARQDELEARGRTTEAEMLTESLDLAIDREIDAHDRILAMAPVGLVGAAVVLRALLDPDIGLPACDSEAHDLAMARALAIIEREGGRYTLPCGLPQPLGRGAVRVLPEVPDPDDGELIDLFPYRGKGTLKRSRS